MKEPIRSKVIEKVISGGQTGVDQAGLRAARSSGLTTGGVCPKGFTTEDGPEKALLQKYKLVESSSADYDVRTMRNVLESDLTILLGSMTGGTKLTASICLRFKKQCTHVREESFKDEQKVDKVVAVILRQHRLKGSALIINIAGNRESKSPGIGSRAQQFIEEVLSKVYDAEQRP